MQGVGNALARIVREEGVGGLFTGAGPTVVRAMALNMGMLASNDQVSISCWWAAAFGGVCSSFFANVRLAACWQLSSRGNATAGRGGLGSETGNDTLRWLSMLRCVGDVRDPLGGVSVQILCS